MVGPEILLLPNDAANLLRELGVSMTAATVKWHAAKGDLPSERTAGGVRVFRRHDVEKFAQRQLTKKDRDEIAKHKEQDLRNAMKKALSKPVNLR